MAQHWMADQKQKRLVMILSSFPQVSETFIVSKFLGLLDRSWDVHIVTNRINNKAWSLFPELAKGSAARGRVHQTWPIQPRWLVPFLMIPALVYCLFSAPSTTLRYLRFGWTRFGVGVFKHFYLDVPLIRLSPDILHFEFGTLAVNKSYLKKLFRCKFTVSFRGYDLNFVGLSDHQYFGDLWNEVDGCHLLSEHLWERAVERGCPPHVFHRLIPPAVNLAEFSSQKKESFHDIGTTERPLRVISVGRLEWKKGYEHALQAIRLLSEKGVEITYHIIGDGNYKTPLYFARHQMNLTGIVEFLGLLPHTEVLEKLAWADVLLHTSLSEGFCNVVLEAQAMSLPVVCSDAGGLPENVVDGVTGFVVPRRDPIAMAEKLATLARDGQLRHRMGLAGRKRVETHFRIEDQLDAFEDFYEQL